MEIGKYYFVVVNNEHRMFNEVVKMYGDTHAETIVTTTLDTERAVLFDTYKDAKELADTYGFKVKKIRTDILGLGSRWNENNQNITNHSSIRVKQIRYEWNFSTQTSKRYGGSVPDGLWGEWIMFWIIATILLGFIILSLLIFVAVIESKKDEKI